MPVDPSVISDQLIAGWGVIIQGQVSESEQMRRRQSEAAQIDNRVYAGIVTRMLLQAGDPNQDADYNTAIRTPSTIDHFALGAGPAAPGAPAGTNAAKAGS